MYHTITLEGHGVRLRPLTREDAPAMRALVDAGSWAGMSVPLPGSDAAMAEHLQHLIEAPSLQAFAVEAGGRLVGRTTLYELVTGLRVEIGHTIYARDIWGTGVNTAVKLVLFAYCFENLRLNRVALRCDSRNIRSHRAIAGLGATYEGTLRGFRPAADGTIVDVDYFSVLAAEWPRVKAHLHARLDTASFPGSME